VHRSSGVLLFEHQQWQDKRSEVQDRWLDSKDKRQGSSMNISIAFSNAAMQETVRLDFENSDAYGSRLAMTSSRNRQKNKKEGKGTRSSKLGTITFSVFLCVSDLFSLLLPRLHHERWELSSECIWPRPTASF
jgi:chromatin remodeling complex protein RSC6